MTNEEGRILAAYYALAISVNEVAGAGWVTAYWGRGDEGRPVAFTFDPDKDMMTVNFNEQGRILEVPGSAVLRFLKGEGEL